MESAKYQVKAQIYKQQYLSNCNSQRPFIQRSLASLRPYDDGLYRGEWGRSVHTSTSTMAVSQEAATGRPQEAKGVEL